jgi:hypothetical protein
VNPTAHFIHSIKAFPAVSSILQLVEGLPEVAEGVINPLIVFPDARDCAVDAQVRLARMRDK